MTLSELNEAPAPTATTWLSACCDAPSWVAAVRDGRPYAEAFFPEVTIALRVTDARHHHVPLLLSPFAYSTYRGS